MFIVIAIDMVSNIITGFVICQSYVPITIIIFILPNN